MEKTITLHLTDDRSLLRNDGTGDYKVDEQGNIDIYGYMQDERFYNEAWLVCLHELIEQRLTQHRGIREEEIDAYDRNICEKGGVSDEAGNERGCIYYKEHHFAECIERLAANELGMNWEDYYQYYI